MRISNPHNPGRAIEQKQRISNRIKTLPLSITPPRTASSSNPGTVISISDHAKRIQEQNKSILQQALSEGIRGSRIFEVRARMDNGSYNSREITQKIAEGMMAEMSLFT